MVTPKINTAVLILLACLLFVLQTLPLLSFRWVEDESWYSATGFGLLHEGQVRNVAFLPTEPESVADTRPLAMPATLAATMATLGFGPARERFPGWLSCLALIPLVFWIGKALGSPEAGVISAFLVSVETTVFMAGRTVRPEAFVALFGATAVLLYFLSQQRQSTGLAILCGLALGIACNYHVNGFGIAASIGLLLLGEFGLSVWRQKRAWAIVLTCVAMLIPFFVWLQGDPVRMRAFHLLYSRGSTQTVANIVHYELIRYKDYIGIANQRFRLIPFSLPLRLHVVLLYVTGFAILAWKRRPVFWKLLALILPSILMWPKEVNPTFRFFVVVTPYLVLAVGIAFTALETAKWRRLLALWCLLAVITQAGGNAIILAKSRSADYNSVARQLRSIIPAGARVYGALTFFLALHDHTYYAWNRGTLDDAIKLGVNYLILNDRVLVNGSGFGSEDWKEVRERANAFVEANGDLIGHVPDPFYGDLQVYRVR
jgi:4-amino-4-deoxy-L-arabinose transferase-like glycosyltransferase